MILPKNYANELIDEFLRIDFMSKDGAIRSAIITTERLIKLGNLPYSEKSYQEYVLLELNKKL